MNKTLIKLFTIGASLIITLVVVISSSYAWFSMSTTPSSMGMQIQVGSNTIKIAPDVTTTVDGKKVHYPGTFSETLNFSKEKSYEYLNNLTKLSLVSTADGINWYLPSGADNDAQDSTDFILDDKLEFSNLEELPADNSVHGGYALMDFWVVSPNDCKLRISDGDTNGGSFFINLPKVISKDDDFGLDMSNDLLASCARVGFLANTQAVKDTSMNKYVESAAYDSKYRSLKGIYQEKGETWNYYPTQFSIYEPNADYHQDETYTLSKDGMNYRVCEDGSYVRTKPMGNVNGEMQPVDITRNVTVQKKTKWLKANDSEFQIEQIFQAFLKGESFPNIDTLTNKFYTKYLGYQCGTYVQKGEFIKRTDSLTKAFDGDGVVDSEIMNQLNTSGATDDVVIVDLEKNIPQRIRMFVWIEGQDVDCSNLSAGGNLLLSLELSGGNE